MSIFLSKKAKTTLWEKVISNFFAGIVGTLVLCIGLSYGMYYGLRKQPEEPKKEHYYLDYKIVYEDYACGDNEEQERYVLQIKNTGFFSDSWRYVGTCSTLENRESLVLEAKAHLEKQIRKHESNEKVLRVSIPVSQTK